MSISPNTWHTSLSYLWHMCLLLCSPFPFFFGQRMTWINIRIFRNVESSVSDIIILNDNFTEQVWMAGSEPWGDGSWQGPAERVGFWGWKWRREEPGGSLGLRLWCVHRSSPVSLEQPCGMGGTQFTKREIQSVASLTEWLFWLLPGEGPLPCWLSR